MTPDQFVMLLKRYFGPWRGVDVEERIKRWLKKQQVPGWVLKDLYRSLTETRKIEPVNTIGIVDIGDELDRYYESPRATNTPQLEAPEDINVVPREEAAARMKELLETLTRNAKVVGKPA